MRSFQRAETLDPVPADIVAVLRRIDRAAGAESRYADQLPRLLTALRHQARIESVTASNAIEGVFVDESRVVGLVSGGTRAFRNRSEAEFAGYTAALDYLNQAETGDLSVGLILHLHRLLYAHADGRGGYFKTEDNLVVEHGADGARVVRFEPVPARETPFFVDELVRRCNAGLDAGDGHPLVVVAAFVLDFLCVHPFGDGNGRVARLLTTYLMQHNGYGVGRYVSLEQLVFSAKEEYYISLAASTSGWFDDGHHQVWPWARYLLVRIDEAYVQFGTRVAAGTSSGSKQDRVRDFILLHASPTFAIADIRRAVPGTSDNTIRLVLAALKSDARIASDGGGRSATWHRT
jgi:Fic family protein